MNHRSTFVDTWGWVALGNGRDAHHSIVTDLFRSLRSEDVPIYTSDLCSMAIMEEHGIKQVITDDDHFLHVGMGFQTIG